MPRHARCVAWAGLGAVLGLAAVAWGQDPAGSPPAEAGDWVSLVGDLGLPGVLAMLGWRLGRLGPLTVQVELGPDSRAWVQLEIERAAGEITAGGSTRRR